MVKIIAHRGASADYPENSLEAIVEARRQGADMVEIDVRQTADGTPVLCHDTNLERVAGVKRQLSEVTADQFKKMRILEDGTPLLLEELLAMDTRPDHIVLDIKEFGLEAKLNELIRRYGCEDRTIVSSFYSIIVRKFSRLNPELETALILDKLATVPLALHLGLLYRVFLPAVKPKCLHLFFWASNLAGARKLARAGYKVAFWTIDDAEDAKRAISARPYGIITNRPLAVRKALEDAGKSAG